MVVVALTGLEADESNKYSIHFFKTELAAAVQPIELVHCLVKPVAICNSVWNWNIY